MASSTLHIHIVKGPKEGEILTPKPGIGIRIGRVVKGNNFTIKDPAISQKHISIKFDPEISRWVLEDLDTSNGTILNDVKIDSLVQIPLSDGDIIKIGATTSISVKIEVDCELVNNNLRRGRSKAQNNFKGLKKDEKLEGFVDESERMIPRRAGLRSRGGSKLTENFVSVVDDSKAFQKNTKRGRPKKTQGQAMVSSEINEEKGEGFENIEEEERNEIVELAVEDNLDEHKNEKVGRKGNAWNKNQASSAKVLKCSDVEILWASVNTEEKEGSLKENVDTLAEDYTEGDGNSIEKENVKEKENVEQKENVEEDTEKEIDFEKMTLGEWFDSLEKYLPLAINEAAEARITELRAQARRFEEYIENVVEELP